ncbi:hypothetical protein JCM3765_002696 [Sporobolomyces pararoseus]
MITHYGWSVQLYLHQLKMLPFDVQTVGSTVFASFTATPQLLSIGSNWTLIWRDDRANKMITSAAGIPGTTVVGVVTESEGSGSNSQTLVGSSISPQSNESISPTVRGTVRMGLTPLKIQLVLQEGHETKVRLGTAQTLASFELTVYPDVPPTTTSTSPSTTFNLTASTTANPRDTVNSGSSSSSSHSYQSSPPTSLPPPYQTPSRHHPHFHHQLENEQHQIYSTPSPQPQPQPSYNNNDYSTTTMVIDQTQRTKILNLEKQLNIAQDQVKYFESTVTNLYSRLSNFELINYLSTGLDEKLSGSLKPEVRISVAISREEVKERLEKEIKEGVLNEVERMIEELRGQGFEKDGKEEMKE